MPALRLPPSDNPQMPHWPTRRDRLRRRDDGVRVDAGGPVEIVHVAGLAKRCHAQRSRPVAVDGAEPAQGGRVAVKHGDQGGVPWHGRQRPLHVGRSGGPTVLAGMLGGHPAGMQSIGRGDGQQIDVPAILR
jgi:hypothetical protein